MELTMRMVPAVSALVAGGALVWFAHVSHRERERRATRVAAIAGVAIIVVLGAASVAPFGVAATAAAVVGVIAVGAMIAGLLPIGRVALNGRPSRRVDERDIMFARARLVPGSREYAAYYAMRPEHRLGDDRTRALPGLLSPTARKAEPEAFASAEESFRRTEEMSADVDGPVASERTGDGAAADSAWVKGLARQFGALDAGIAEVRAYHVYSHVGRGPGVYGEAIQLDHRWAIAFTVEMDHAVMRTAPEAPVVAESARRYVQAAEIGVEVAAAIRSRGYPARAHIDGNYRVIAPLVAWDAGLGEIGRMGILLTPHHGPRVRIGVVTTDLPLIADPPGDDASVLDFCSHCRKCAENCPTNSIPFGDREPADGGRRWVLDSESCFRYWNLVGTDCGRCMTVCPYAHPDHPAHNLVRWLLHRSGGARRAGRWLDDAFYGRDPEALPPR